MRRAPGWRSISILVVLVLGLLASATLFAAPALAFKPAGHNALLNSIAQELPPGDPFREAYLNGGTTTKQVANWGAWGPDLGAAWIGTLFRFNPWADAWHDYKSGSMGEAVMRNAIDSDSPTRKAFALGYVAHMVGDFAAHGYLTNPAPWPPGSPTGKVGVAFDQPRTSSSKDILGSIPTMGNGAADEHDRLETAAERVIWTSPEMGKHGTMVGQTWLPDYSQFNMNEFPKLFWPVPYSNPDMLAANAEVYGASSVLKFGPNIDLLSLWRYQSPDTAALTKFGYAVMQEKTLDGVADSGFWTRMDLAAAYGFGPGFMYTGPKLRTLLNEKFLNDVKIKLYNMEENLTADDLKRLQDGYKDAVKRGAAMILEAESGDYHAYSDAHQLDVGVQDMANKPVPAMQVTVNTATESQDILGCLEHRDGPGTDDPTWIAFIKTDNTMVVKELGRGILGTDARFLLNMVPPQLLGQYGDFNEMESGKTDTFSIYLPDMKPEEIKAIALMKGADGINGGWRPNFMSIAINGRYVWQSAINTWLDGDSRTITWPVESAFRETEPPAPASGFSASCDSDGFVRLSWTNPTSRLAKVRILRSEVGKAGWPGDAVDQVMIYEGTDASFVDGNVTGSKAYTYTIFTLNKWERWAPGPSNLRYAHVTTPQPAPTPVTGLVAVSGNGAVSLTWANPASPHFKKAVVVRKLGAVPSSLADGQTMTLTAPNALIDKTVTNGQTYGYAVWAEDDLGAHSAPSNATAMPSATAADTIKPDPVTNLAITAEGEHGISLQWDNPGDSDFEAVRIVRSPVGPAASPDPPSWIQNVNGIPIDVLGQVQWLAYQGTGASSAAMRPIEVLPRPTPLPIPLTGVFADSGLLLTFREANLDLDTLPTIVRQQIEPNLDRVGVRYCYTVFAKDRAGNWSNRAYVWGQTRDKTAPVVYLDGVTTGYSRAAAADRWRIGLKYTPRTGWLNRDVSLSLSADDAGVGVDSIHYSFAGSTVAADTVAGSGSGPFGLPKLTAEGTTTVSFWADDKVSPANVAPTKSVEVRIDKTAPTSVAAVAASYDGTATISFTGADALSGLAGIDYEVDGRSGLVDSGGTASVAVPGSHTITYWAVDRAGNEETHHSATFSVTTGSTLRALAGATSVPAGSSSLLYAFLTPDVGVAEAGKPIVFERYDDGAAGWRSVGTTVTQGGGIATLTVSPSPGETWYRARFAGDAYVRSSTSSQIKVTGTGSATVAEPLFIPEGGSFASSLDVTMTCATPGATIGTPLTVPIRPSRLRRTRRRSTWPRRRRSRPERSRRT